MICSNFKLSNLNFAIFCQGVFYGGESVNINAGVVVSPSGMPTVRVVVSVKELKPHREWQFFHDLSEAPAGDLD
jgi:hypothetical protein